MATDKAAILDPDPRATFILKDEALVEMEYPIQLAYKPEPALCLAGTVSLITAGRRDLALSDQEWHSLEFVEQPEAMELETVANDDE